MEAPASEAEGVVMGKASRDKGKRGELAARAPLLQLTGCEWERSARQSRPGGGKECPDLTCAQRPQLHVEVKVGKAPPCLPALDQATWDCAEHSVPFALVKRDRGVWVLVVEVARFEELVAALKGAAREGL